MALELRGVRVIPTHVTCQECGQATPYVKPSVCMGMIGKSYARVAQLLKAGRFRNAIPPDGRVDHWRIPLSDIKASLEARG